MNILISNDDGYLAPGIKILAQVAAEYANVRVIAPERNRSGASNSLTLDRPLNLAQAENGFYYVDGTPTDCIHIASHAFPDFQPDLVLSGINNGANMGDDTLYSGTVAAATEAHMLGLSAIAFSLNDKSGLHWQDAEEQLRIILPLLLQRLPESPVLWNINLPAISAENVQGLKIARLGKRHHHQSVHAMQSPRGDTVYWIGAAGDVADKEEDTDFAIVERGYIALTPLSTDLTHTSQLPTLTPLAKQTWFPR